MIEQRFINKKKPSKNGRDTEEEDEDRKRKGKPLDQNSPNVELGVFGVNNVNNNPKKREKTQRDAKPAKQAEIKGLNSSGKELPAEMLDFNLKGVNVRLNEKLPFVMAPKDKKKK